MPGRISPIIHSVCKELNINYKSKHYEEHVFMKDAETLAEIYLELKKIITQLEEIEVRHNLNGIGNLLMDDIHELVNMEHNLMKVANQIYMEGEKNEL